MNLQAGTKVLVEAVVTSCGNTICGIALHGYENTQRLVEVIKEHVHPFPGVQEWRPIESAPTLKYVLVGSGSGSVHFTVIAAKHEDDGKWYQPEDDFSMCLNPTHWMPLPPPPSSAEQGERN